mmetsp:Transcript_25677/g.60779  ORF Transcript_25677/g.60779 Transcript_25677/m.60779 type:complete len:96 (-) Transcript_25677:2383-2670(-)
MVFRFGSFTVCSLELLVVISRKFRDEWQFDTNFSTYSVVLFASQRSQNDAGEEEGNLLPLLATVKKRGMRIDLTKTKHDMDAYHFPFDAPALLFP